MIDYSELISIGHVSKPHGLGGEVVICFTDDAFDREEHEYLFLKIDGIMVPFFWESYRYRTDDTALFKFEGVDSSESAREIQGAEVYYPRIMHHDGDQWSFNDLKGLMVEDSSLGNIGRIMSIDDSTENILLEVDHKGRDILIPLVQDFIIGIDWDGGTVTVSLPEGLLDL